MNTSTPSSPTAAPRYFHVGFSFSADRFPVEASSPAEAILAFAAMRKIEPRDLVVEEVTEAVESFSAPSPTAPAFSPVVRALGPLVGENYATSIGYSDRAPFEIVGRTAKTILVRRMDYAIADDFRPDTIPGGFCGHTRNNYEQKWLLSSDLSASVHRAHLRKNGDYYLNGTRLRVGSAAYFYDYNF